MPDVKFPNGTTLRYKEATQRDTKNYTVKETKPMIKNPKALMKYIEHDVLDFIGCRMVECEVLINNKDNHDKIYVPIIGVMRDKQGDDEYFVVGVYGKNGAVNFKNDLKGKNLSLDDADSQFTQLSRSKQKSAKGYEYDSDSTSLLKEHYSLAVNNRVKEDALNMVEGLLDKM